MLMQQPSATSSNRLQQRFKRAVDDAGCSQAIERYCVVWAHNSAHTLCSSHATAAEGASDQYVVLVIEVKSALVCMPDRRGAGRGGGAALGKGLQLRPAKNPRSRTMANVLQNVPTCTTCLGLILLCCCSAGWCESTKRQRITRRPGQVRTKEMIPHDAMGASLDSPSTSE